MTLIGISSLPFYLFSDNLSILMIGAFFVGVGTGNFGMTPAYLAERFPTAVRAAGAGFAYQAGGGLAAVTPTIIGMLEDRGMPLATAMTWCTAVAGLLVLVLLALGPETRGRELTSDGG